MSFFVPPGTIEPGTSKIDSPNRCDSEVVNQLILSSKGCNRHQGVSKDDHPKTRIFNTKTHKRTDRGQTLRVKRVTGVKRTPRFFSIKKKSNESKNEQSYLTLKILRLHGLVFSIQRYDR